MIKETNQERESRHGKIYKQLKDQFQIEDLSGVELFTSLARIAQLGEMIAMTHVNGSDVSIPRWRILLHLFIAEQFGNTKGLTPTMLSEFRQVSKNTVSSLLRGLEEKGLIQREMDPSDLRIFHIRLTDAGRQVVIDSAPPRLIGMNKMLSGLSREEIQQLLDLLRKLRGSLESQCCQMQQNQTDPQKGPA
jgi:DNA-binding MarR family transcriptional regulator